jgi:hypothetical protein
MPKVQLSLNARAGQEGNLPLHILKLHILKTYDKVVILLSGVPISFL